MVIFGARPISGPKMGVFKYSVSAFEVGGGGLTKNADAGKGEAVGEFADTTQPLKWRMGKLWLRA